MAHSADPDVSVRQERSSADARFAARPAGVRNLRPRKFRINRAGIYGSDIGAIKNNKERLKISAGKIVVTYLASMLHDCQHFNWHALSLLRP